LYEDAVHISQSTVFQLESPINECYIGKLQTILLCGQKADVMLNLW